MFSSTVTKTSIEVMCMLINYMVGILSQYICITNHHNRYFKYLVVFVQSLSHVWLFTTHELQHARLLCPSLSPGVHSNSCSLNWWCHPTISSFVIPFSSRPQSFPASGSFPMSQLFVSSGQSTGASASASVFPMNIQDWFPLGLTGLISLKS